MGKSMVLKDERNRLCGYLIVSGGEWICRVKADEPAQAVLFFEDGTQQMFELTGGAERRLCSADAQVTGCCVLCANTLLASDDAARYAYAKFQRESEVKKQSIRDAHKREEEKDIKEEHRTTEIYKKEDTNPMDDDDGAEQRLWPQRRWPPPPCWESARYQSGKWQDLETKET